MSKTISTGEMENSGGLILSSSGWLENFDRMAMKTVLALSGGLDSTTLCGYYLETDQEVIPVGFNYGSKHNRYENMAADSVAKFFGINKPKLLDLDFIGKLFKSDLLLSGDEIPEGHYTDQSMTATVVPARNLIFASILNQ